jgi:myo-inositol-1(or 4)-monophosphatase
MDWQKILDATRQAAMEAGEIVIRDNAAPREVSRKGRIDLVTATDLAVEEFLKPRLAAILPGAAIVAEETAAGERLGDLAFVLDPVDGTTNFAHGLPFVGISIGLWVEGAVKLGVLNAPLLGECFWALRGAGAYLNGRPMHVSAADTLADSLVATGFPYAIRERIDTVLGNMRRVLLAAQGLRRAGAAALDLAYVACGRLDGFYETDLKPWDTAAGLLLVEEAGGRVSRFDAAKEYRLGDFSILATNGRVHRELSALLAEEAVKSACPAGRGSSAPRRRPAPG